MPHRKLKEMFEEYNRSYFDDLYQNNVEFTYLANRYHTLDEEIRKLKDDTSHNLRERLKKHRMQIKDEAYKILIDYKITQE